MIQIIDTKEFINKLTLNRLNDRQLNRAIAYLRAKRVCFYDNWSKSHSHILSNEYKKEFINALKLTLNQLN